MIILTDVDGVLADFIGHLYTRCDVQSRVREWDLRHSLTAEELDRVNAMSLAPEFCADIPWLPGAEEFLHDLIHLEDVEVFAVTAPWYSKTWDHERRNWLQDHIPAHRVISIAGKSKHLVTGDVLIEDHPGTAASWLRAHPNGYAILMDRPWNTEDTKTYQDARVGEEVRRMFRAHSYDEVLGLVEGIKWALQIRES